MNFSQRKIAIGALFVLIAMLCSGFLWVPSTSAKALHAILLRSQPSQDEIRATPPESICLWFSESAQAVGDSIGVLGPDGIHVHVGGLQVQGTRFCVPISLHISGSYLVSWQVISLDTEPASGSFIFNLHHSGGEWTRTASSGTSIYGLALQVLARLLHFLGYALCFGILAFRWFVLQPLQLHNIVSIQRRLERLILPGIGLLLLAEPLALLAQIASLTTTDVGSLLGAILASSFGRVLAQRLGIALLVWVILGMLNGNGSGQEESRIAKMVILGLALLLALVDGEASHAISKEPIWLGMLANMVHIAAMGLWVGGLAALLTLWKVKYLLEQRGAIALRFGQIATIAVSELIISGLLMAWLRLNQPLNLVTTVYGRVLLAKICLLPLVLLLAWISRRVRQNKQASWWQLEELGLLGLLVVAGLLVTLPPPL